MVSDPSRPGPKGQDSLAQGLREGSQKNVLSPEGAKGRECMGSPVGSRFSPYLTALSGLIPGSELTQGKPWALFYWPLRATDFVPSDYLSQFPLCDLCAMHSPYRRFRTVAPHHFAPSL
jgi:hypothetical protein